MLPVVSVCHYWERYCYLSWASGITETVNASCRERLSLLRPPLLPDVSIWHYWNFYCCLAWACGITETVTATFVSVRHYRDCYCYLSLSSVITENVTATCREFLELLRYLLLPAVTLTTNNSNVLSNARISRQVAVTLSVMLESHDR